MASLTNIKTFKTFKISLYTTVPAHIISKNLCCHKLTATDMHQLLSIIVENTYFTYNRNTNQPIRGLPMGSSISGILVISYMDQLERRALSICPKYIFFIRNIDEILMLTSSSEEATVTDEKFFNIDKHIKFKIEHPDNTGFLSLLDFRIQISSIGKIYTGFYRKPLCVSISTQCQSKLY